MSVGPLVSSSITNYSGNPENPITANPPETEIVLGNIADIGVAVGLSDLSGTGGNCEGYSINIGSGKYGGVQITLRTEQDRTRSIFNPLRYIDGISIGIGVGISLPVSVSRSIK